MNTPLLRTIFLSLGFALLWVTLGSVEQPGEVAEVAAKSRKRLVDEEALSAEFTAQVEALLPWRDAKLAPITELTLRGKLPAMWRMEVMAPGSWRTARVQAKIFDVERPEHPVAFLQGTLEIEVGVVMARATIDAGQPLSPALLERVYVPVQKLPHDAVTELDEELADKVARRAITPSQPISRSQLDDPIIFERGAVITLTVKRGNVSLTDTGVALSVGKLGSIVRVQSLSTKAIVSGTVRRDGVVF